MPRSILLAFVLLLMSQPARASATTGFDLHWYWDNNCAECHDHSSKFARKFLHISNDQLQGRHHVDNLLVFMRHHYTRSDQAAAIHDMLKAQVATEPRFKQHCSTCHGTAASLVRDSSILRNGVLMSLRSGQTTRQFLQGHRRLTPQDIDFYENLLIRIALETGQF
jgi:hypothetical protein